jgi:hypothetical protein
MYVIARRESSLASFAYTRTDARKPPAISTCFRRLPCQRFPDQFSRTASTDIQERNKTSARHRELEL